MKIVGIFDTEEQKIGNRLSGMQTYLVKQKDELIEALNEVKNDSNVGILVFNENTYQMAEERIKEIKKKNLPLVIKL